MENRIKGVMATVLQVPAEEITEQTSPIDIASWDSLRHIKLVTALEEEFNISFGYDEIDSLINYKIIKVTIKGYLEQRNV